tara:strand:- start:3564 stop:6764 length:3201 start_codon:yes stop_codon:yes gene_type:complete
MAIQTRRTPEDNDDNDGNKGVEEVEEQLPPVNQVATEADVKASEELADGVGHGIDSKLYAKMIRSNKFTSEATQKKVIEMVCTYAYIGLVHHYDNSLEAMQDSANGSWTLEEYLATETVDNYVTAALGKTGQNAVAAQHRGKNDGSNFPDPAVTFYRYITQSYMWRDVHDALSLKKLSGRVAALEGGASLARASPSSTVLKYPSTTKDGIIELASMSVRSAAAPTEQETSQYLDRMKNFLNSQSQGFVIACMTEAGKRGRLKAYRSAMEGVLTFARKEYRLAADRELKGKQSEVSSLKARGNKSEIEKVRAEYAKKSFMKTYILKSLRSEMRETMSVSGIDLLQKIVPPEGIDLNVFRKVIEEVTPTQDDAGNKTNAKDFLKAVTQKLSEFVGSSPNVSGKPTSMENIAAHFKKKYALKSGQTGETGKLAALFGYIPVCDRNELLARIFPTGKNMGRVRRKTATELYREIKDSPSVLAVMTGTTVETAETVFENSAAMDAIVKAFRIGDTEVQSTALSKYSHAKHEYMKTHRTMPHWWVHVSGVQPNMKYRRDMHSSLKRYADAVGDSIFPASVMKSAMKACLARQAFARNSSSGNSDRGLPAMAEEAIDTMQGICLQFIKEVGRLTEVYSVGDDKKRKTCSSSVAEGKGTLGGVVIGKNSKEVRRCATASVSTQPPPVGMAVMSILCGSTVAYESGQMSAVVVSEESKTNKLKKALKDATDDYKRDAATAKNIETARNAIAANSVTLKALKDNIKASTEFAPDAQRSALTQKSASHRRRLFAARDGNGKSLNAEMGTALAGMLMTEGDYFLKKRALDSSVLYEPRGMLTHTFASLLQHNEVAGEVLKLHRADITPASGDVVDFVKNGVNGLLRATSSDGTEEVTELLPFLKRLRKRNGPLATPKRGSAVDDKKHRNGLGYVALDTDDFNFKAGKGEAHLCSKQELKGVVFSVALIKRVMLKNTNVRLSTRAATVVAVAVTSLLDTLMTIFYDGWSEASRHKMYPNDLLSGLLPTSKAGSVSGISNLDMADRLAMFAMLKRLKCSLVSSTQDFTDMPQELVQKFHI